MKRFGLHIIILYIGVLLLGSCRDSLPLPEEPDPAIRTEAERTVIVYMLADNSLAGSVRQDTTEMVQAKDLIPADVNFILFLDDKLNKPAIYELSAAGGMQLWKQYDEELCCTDSLTMFQILHGIEHFFPARHYGLTLWSHATGWTPRRKTFGKDETLGASTTAEPEMEIPILHDVLAQLPRFDYIFFDACFMACIEVAYQLRDVADFMVSSPAEIPGPGAPYDKVMEALCKGDAKGIVSAYDSAYPGRYSNFYYSGVLLSCIDLQKVEALAQATGPLLVPYYMNRTEQPGTEFQAYCTYLTKYTHFYDMRTTMHRLLPASDYEAWMKAFDEAVPLRTLSSTNRWFANYCTDATVHDPDNYGGVSMFVPRSVYDAYGWNDKFRETAWYKAIGFSQTGW